MRLVSQMSDETLRFIKAICESSFSEGDWRERAQESIKRVGPIAKRCKGKKGDVPFPYLERFLYSIVKKYAVYVGSITVITDVNGNTSFHAGMSAYDSRNHINSRKWLFTVHADTMYDLYLKLCLMAFVEAKKGSIVERAKDE